MNLEKYNFTYDGFEITFYENPIIENSGANNLEFFAKVSKNNQCMVYPLHVGSLTTFEFFLSGIAQTNMLERTEYGIDRQIKSFIKAVKQGLMTAHWNELDKEKVKGELPWSNYLM